LKERLASIPPAADVVCPFCATPLICGNGTSWSCPACNAVRY
jgi:rubrerythrin